MATESGRLTGSSSLRSPEPVPVSAHSGDDPGRIIRAFNSRLNIYRAKRRDADQLGPDCYSRREALTYVIEALEITALEAGLSAHVPHGDDQ
jgi:hypothetical protein